MGDKAELGDRMKWTSGVLFPGGTRKTGTSSRVIITWHHRSVFTPQYLDNRIPQRFCFPWIGGVEPRTESSVQL